MNNLTCELFWDIVLCPSRHYSLPHGVSLQSATWDIACNHFFELGRCACSTHKTLYKICSQELTRILLIFHFELNFNKCPLQPVFDSKKRVSRTLVARKEKQTWDNKSETKWNIATEVLSCVILLVTFLWSMLEMGFICVILLVTYLWSVLDMCFFCVILLVTYLRSMLEPKQYLFLRKKVRDTSNISLV